MNAKPNSEKEIKAFMSGLKKRNPGAETIFNELAPFYASMAVYVVAFLLAAFSWINNGVALRVSAFRVLLIGLTIHTIGLIVRMTLEGRPPRHQPLLIRRLHRLGIYRTQRRT